MAVTNKWYGQAFLQAFDKEIDFLADTIKVTLHNSTYSPAQDTDDYANDATNELTTANGYTAGGGTLDNKINDYTAGTNVNRFTAVRHISNLTRLAVIRIVVRKGGTDHVIGVDLIGEARNDRIATRTGLARVQDCHEIEQVAVPVEVDARIGIAAEHARDANQVRIGCSGRAIFTSARG